MATVYNVTGYNHTQNISRFKSFLFYLAPLVGVFEIDGFHKSGSESGLDGLKNERSCSQKPGHPLLKKCLKLVLVLKI